MMHMSSRVLKSEQEKIEYHDKPKELEEKIEKFADYLRDARSVVFFTGEQLNSKVGNPKLRSGFPTKGHMAVKELMDRDIVKTVITQNTDGLHRKSGIPKDKLFELNGNTHKEVCEKCHMDYMRDFCVVESKTLTDHRTSRKCDNSSCNGQLHDSTIHHTEKQDPQMISDALDATLKADVIICLGANMSEMSANQIPISQTKNPRKFIVISHHKTTID